MAHVRSILKDNHGLLKFVVCIHEEHPSVVVNTTDCHTGVQASAACSRDSVSKKYNVDFCSVCVYGFNIVGGVSVTEK